jgi:hypothetical protein
MSVEFGECMGCGETICDVDLTACDCGKQFCAPPDGTKCGGIVEDEDAGTTTCKFCRNESITDNDLLHYCLAAMNLTYKEAQKLALAGKKMAAKAKKDGG